MAKQPRATGFFDVAEAINHQAARSAKQDLAMSAVNAPFAKYDITDENGDPVLVEATDVDGIAMRHRVVGKIDAESIMRRAIEADDVYAELDLIIRDMRMVAQHRGVDEVQLGRLICAIIGQNATALLKPAAGAA